MDQQPSGYIQARWVGGRTETWNFRLVREDGTTVMTSGSYDSQHEMNEAIVWARTNVGRVEILQAKGRRPRPPANRRRPRPPVPQRWIFALADDNQKMVLISHPWDSEQEAEEAMAWVKAVARRAEVRTLDPPTPAYEAWRRLPRELP